MPLFNDRISSLQPHVTDARPETVTNDIQSKLAQIRAGADGARAIADLKKLLVCRGGFTVEAAEALLEESAPTSLSLLRSRGLLRLEGKRYVPDALVEEALTPDESARSAHYDFYLALAKAHDQRQDYVGLKAESANLVAAFEWALGEKEYEKALNLLDTSFGFLVSIEIKRWRARELVKQAERVCDAVAEHPDRLVWAKAQNLLGAAYHVLAQEEASVNPGAKLGRAVKCYQRALQYRTPDADPLEYAETQNNLGVAYIYLAITDFTYLKRAVECFQRALEHLTPDSTPLQYFIVQGNIGAAYLRLADFDFKDRAANLKRAVECCQRALKYCSPKAAPVSYPRQQNTLGDAYFRLARIEDRDLNLYRAVECYQRALKYFTPNIAPEEYAETQYDLGLAYQALKDEEKARAAFQEAKRRPRPILRAVFDSLLIPQICGLLVMSAGTILLAISLPEILYILISVLSNESSLGGFVTVICTLVFLGVGLISAAWSVVYGTRTLYYTLKELMRL